MKNWEIFADDGELELGFDTIASGLSEEEAHRHARMLIEITGVYHGANKKIGKITPARTYDELDGGQRETIRRHGLTVVFDQHVPDKSWQRRFDERNQAVMDKFIIEYEQTTGYFDVSKDVAADMRASIQF